MKKCLVIVSSLVLTACASPEPSPARMKLNQACHEGSIEACAAVANVEAQEAALENAKNDHLIRSGLDMMYGGSGSY